ncbi:MAG: hypothetical protein L0154_10485 [Chloroflexi bacterium]|nr:hypothetical protein [Chloroflexota bacterium]
MLHYPVNVVKWKQLVPQLIKTMHPPDPNPRAPFEQLYSDLMEPIERLNCEQFEADRIEFKLVELDSEYAAIATKIVSLGYGTRYLRRGAYLTQLVHFIDLDNQRMAVATYDTGEGELVLGTVSGYMELPEVLNLFEPTGQAGWAHHFDEIPAELKRFAMHPLLDGRRLAEPYMSWLNTYKRLITRGMVQVLLDEFKDHNARVAYYIISPKIERFVRSTGMSGERMELVPADNEYAYTVRQVYPIYWKPDAPREEQPYCYVLPDLALEADDEQRLLAEVHG